MKKEEHPIHLTYTVLQQGVYGRRLVNNSELDSCHYCAASQRRRCDKQRETRLLGCFTNVIIYRTTDKT